MLSNEIHGDKIGMRNMLSVGRLIQPTLVLLVLLSVSPVLLAQSAPIEPCPATPTPKPAIGAPGTPTKVSTKASETLIDSSIADDPDIEKLLRPYSDKVRALSVVIGRLEGEMKKGSVGAGTLGQFVSDAILAETRKRTGKNIAFALTNAGGLRKNEIAPGQLHVSDIFELLPFENELITLDVTGAQLRKLGELTTRNAQAGARVQFRWNDQNRTEVIETKLLDPNGGEIEIDNNRTYTIVTIDYLYKLNSGSYAILQEGKNLQSLNLTIRDAVVDYVKAETAAGRPIRGHLDNRFVQVGPGPSKPVTPPND
jgi:2',3'-cyclic-nucleotide 2'-phosphodiesterase (5'-nucleotidase family)